MNKNSLKLILFCLIVVFGSSIFILPARAKNGLSLEVIKECNIQSAGDICIAELKLTNSTGEILDGKAFLHITYKGAYSNNKLVDFDGEGTKAQFSAASNKWLNFSGWKNGITAASGFEIAEDKTQMKLKIKTHPALMPGQYSFIFTIKGTAKKEEYITSPVVIGGGSGDFIAPELTIYEEQAQPLGPGEDFITITWNTNHPAFSQVIYGLYPGKFDLSAGKPAYGYAHFTSLTKKADVSHSVELTGLMPGTTYYYRLVSYTPYGSFAVSPEYSFTTLGQITGEEEEPPLAPRPEPDFAPTAEPEEDYAEPEQPFSMDEIEIPSEEEEDRRGILSAAASLFGAIGDWFSCIPWYLALIVALIITASAFLFKSIRQNRVKIVGTLIIALLLLLAIIFWFPCIPWYIILITIFLLPLIFLKP